MIDANRLFFFCAVFLLGFGAGGLYAQQRAEEVISALDRRLADIQFEYEARLVDLSEFMDSCKEERKYYECVTMWGGGSGHSL